MLKNGCFGNTCNKKIISRDNQHPHSNFVAMHGSRAGIQIGSKSGTYLMPRHFDQRAGRQ
jgi:hypothetical protein